ncbi:hypothetical protein J4429_03845 [Candidatus Pacearchaeota archaeon]|nr:hypothetical protein [Candidatus Pacearchaeota archaeon]
MDKRSVGQVLEEMQIELTKESHRRLDAEREQRETQKNEQMRRRKDLERYLDSTYNNVCKEIQALKESLNKIEDYCFQAGACFPEELKTKRDDLAKSVNEYHTSVDRLLYARKKEIREGNIYAGPQNKPDSSPDNENQTQ